MIIDHTHPEYRARLHAIGEGAYNGARYYSTEIVKHFIPVIKTDRPWVTVMIPGRCYDDAIVFVHNNLQVERYDWLRRYHNLILVCGLPETCERVRHLGHAVYLPLSVDVQEVSRYIREDKDREAVYAGRLAKRPDSMRDLPALHGLPRPQFLRGLARYKKVYCVGRVAIEAQVLGCAVETSDPERFPDLSRFRVIDSREAAQMLQTQIDLIDKQEK